MEIPSPDKLEDQLGDADRRQLVHQALQKLPEAQRVPLVLYHFENLRYEEIAVKLGVSLSKVKTDIFRARDALRRRLKLTIGDEEGWAQPQAAQKNQPVLDERKKSNSWRGAARLLVT